jgi:hypothetical protein
MIQEYKSTSIVGNRCFLHEGFVEPMNKFVESLAETGCTALITSSFRKTIIVQGAIVEPARMSNHLVGHAIDCNIYDRSGHLWDHKQLAEPKNEVLEFINLVTSKGLCWGGRFRTPDTVHFDDRLNVINPDLWASIYNQLHAK